MLGCHQESAPVGTSGGVITAIAPLGPAPVHTTPQDHMSLILVRHYCPACGFPGLARPAYARLGPPPWIHPGSPPYHRWYGDPSYQVCPCCGFEPGNDDDSWGGSVQAQSFGDYLRDWISSGANWLEESHKPRGWDLTRQLSDAGISVDPHE
jgi:hypothetical protein